MQHSNEQRARWREVGRACQRKEGGVPRATVLLGLGRTRGEAARQRQAKRKWIPAETGDQEDSGGNEKEVVSET